MTQIKLIRTNVLEKTSVIELTPTTLGGPTAIAGGGVKEMVH